MRTQMIEATTSGLYDLWARFYDWTFGALVIQRQAKAVQTLGARPGQRVLDMGTGTGMTLKYHPPGVEIIGLDLSAGMLAKAARKVRELGSVNVQLVQGDALHPPFAEHSFDHVLITHVISVVSDPVALLNAASRMVKPGGRIVICNHFQSTHGLVRFFERALNPMFVRIGWRSDLELSELLRQCPLGVAYQFKMGIMDLWQIVVLTDDPRLPRVPTEVSHIPPSKRWRSAVSAG